MVVDRCVNYEQSPSDKGSSPLRVCCKRGIHVLRSPNLLFILKNYSPQEAGNAVISQRNYPVDIHIFHNAHATIAWPQQTLL